MSTDMAVIAVALDHLFAYDMGSRAAGVHDEGLKAATKDAVRGLDRPALARILRDMWLSEDAITQGYGAEDLLQFIVWLDKEMDLTLSR